MLRDAPHNLNYLDLDFFITSESLFDEAQDLVEPGSLYDSNIRDERLILDGDLVPGIDDLLRGIALVLDAAVTMRGLPDGRI